MGLFSFLENAAKTALAVALSPVVAAGYGVYKVGKAVGLISDDVGKTEALTETSSVAQVEDISKTVRKYYNEYESIGEAKEETARKNIEIFFNGLENLLQKERQLAEDYGMSQLRRKKDRLCRDIEGTITDAIMLNLSLDNSECRQILSMQAGNEKSRKMKEFAERTIETANKNLEQKVRKSMNEVQDDILRFMQSKINEQEQKAYSEQKKFDDWVRDMENKTFDKEKAQLEPRIKIYAIEQVEKIFAA